MSDDESESDGVAQGGIGVSAAERIAMMQWTHSVSELGVGLLRRVDEPTILDRQHIAHSAAKTLGTCTGLASASYGVAWSPDGKQVASPSQDGTVVVWKPS